MDSSKIIALVWESVLVKHGVTLLYKEGNKYQYENYWKKNKI